MSRARRAAAALLLSGCTAGGAGAPTCAAPERTGTLPEEVRESSGLALSRRHPGVLWTHNDSGGGPELFAIDTAGTVLGRMRVRNARNRDWEDVALGPCPTGDCIYIADTGDNLEDQRAAVLYRVPEPAPGDTVTAPAERFPVRLPEGPRDMEALYVLPDGGVYLISKGRSNAIGVYRYAPPLRAGVEATLEPVQTLSSGSVRLAHQVTGAGATPDGAWVVVRTYTTVQFFRVRRGGRLAAVGGAPALDVQGLVEAQGEAVDVRADGAVLLTSEAGPSGVPGLVARLECPIR